MIGGPEVQRLLGDFCGTDNNGDQFSDSHHEQTPGFQNKFSAQCFALKESFLSSEDPFAFESNELISLGSRSVASKEAVGNLYLLEEKGITAFMSFIDDRLLKKTVSVHDKISQIKCQVFTLTIKKSLNVTSAFVTLKNNLNLFVRLFIVCQARRMDLSDFFKHENQLCPPSLSLDGNIRPGVKALLGTILEKMIPNPTDPPS